MLWAILGLAAFGLLLGVLVFRRGTADPEPERLKRKVHAMAQDLIRDRWVTMRKAVALVGTDEGARAFYQANPGLATRIHTEAAFLRAASGWRRVLEPLPEGLPDLETRDLTYTETTESTEMSYQTSKGVVVFLKWASDDRLVEMRIY
jgi:hypothetical protein